MTPQAPPFPGLSPVPALGACPMPTRGTYPTQMRLTDDDKAKVDAIQEWLGFSSRTEVVRFAIEKLHASLARKKIRENSNPST
jgi:hypothetical protein